MKETRWTMAPVCGTGCFNFVRSRSTGCFELKKKNFFVRSKAPVRMFHLVGSKSTGCFKIRQFFLRSRMPVRETGSFNSG